MNFWVKNNSGKTIKYLNFHLKPFNSVNDFVSSEYEHQNEQKLQCTEPISPNQELELNWENCWYNNSIVGAKLDYVEITYMDGTTEKLNGSEVERMEKMKKGSQDALVGCLLLLVIIFLYFVIDLML
ncbi:MAG: hypothetical protein V3G42_00795 [Oscillospiraceae bacterium]